MPAKRNVIERIERSIINQSDDDCWITHYSQKGGRSTHVTIRADRMRSLHRIAWEAHNAEPIPEGMIVMHTCDNPPCCNPAHLVLGTPKDNTHDAISKGRLDMSAIARIRWSD